jgi:hypothetical protein
MAVSATYGSNPIASELDAVRLWIGDTDMADPILTDPEIQYFITTYDGIEEAASYSCEAIASKFSRMVDTSVGDVRIMYNQRVQKYLDLAARFRSRNVAKAMPWAGGISIAYKQSQAQNNGVTQPAFRKGMQTNYDGSGTTPYQPQSNQVGAEVSDDGI